MISDTSSAGDATARGFPRRRGRTWFLVVLCLAILCAMAAGTAAWNRWGMRVIPQRPVRYDVPLGRVIEKADMIVVRDGGFNCCGDVGADTVLFAVADPPEVREVAAHIRFEPVVTRNSLGESCLCCGWPGMDWYRDGRRIALTSIQHGHAVRWSGFSSARVLGVGIGYGDGPLTEQSQEWLADWLDRHGVPQVKAEREKLKGAREKHAREARQAAKPAGEAEAEGGKR